MHDDTVTTERRRATNARGQGAALKEEILEAASRLLVAATTRGAVTLRAIAREADIAAPSVYLHFADRDAVLDAVAHRAFRLLLASNELAVATATSGSEAVRAIGRGYLRLAREHPGEYGIMFERSAGDGTGQQYSEGIAAFAVLADAVRRSVAEGGSSSTDPVRDAQALWVALHGLVTLVPATPAFPWPPIDELLDTMLHALVGLAAE